jgi:hypothetical protein
MRLILALPCLVLVLGLAGCFSGPAELTQEQACLAHNENDPVERDRCRQSAATRHDTVPDVRPQQLPIRTGQPSD